MDVEHYSLEELGWSSWFEEQIKRSAFNVGSVADPVMVSWDPAWRPARISADYGVEYEVFSPEHDAERVVLAGKMRSLRKDPLRRPAVGDWVAIEGDQLVVARFERHTEFVRKAAGEQYRPQVLAANIDIVFIVTSMNKEFNLRRLERYLTAVSESGAKPVILLNKSDLVSDNTPFIEQAKGLQEGVECVPLTTMKRCGRSSVEVLHDYLKPGRTIALVGSSGVGKSTITNQILGTSYLRTAQIRMCDDEGRHTTTHREMVVLPENRGLLIDTPGMREFGLWLESDEALGDTFQEIEEAAERCRFRDCQHENEPGCAVKEDVKVGIICPTRLSSWRTLQEESEQKESYQRNTSRRRKKK